MEAGPGRGAGAVDDHVSLHRNLLARHKPGRRPQFHGASSLVRVTGGDEHLRAEPHTQARGADAHSPAGPDHQQRFAGRKPSPAKHAVGSQAAQTVGGRLFPRVRPAGRPTRLASPTTTEPPCAPQ